MSENHYQQPALKLREGADPWPIIRTLMVQVDALTSTLLVLSNCFETPARAAAPAAESGGRRTFGRHNRVAPVDPDAKGVSSPSDSQE